MPRQNGRHYVSTVRAQFIRGGGTASDKEHCSCYLKTSRRDKRRAFYTRAASRALGARDSFMKGAFSRRFLS